MEDELLKKAVNQSAARGLEKDCGFYLFNLRWCRNRWHNHLAYPDAKRGEWESYEDELLKRRLINPAASGTGKRSRILPCLTVLPQGCNRWHNPLVTPDAGKRWRMESYEDESC